MVLICCVTCSKFLINFACVLYKSNGTTVNTHCVLHHETPQMCFTVLHFMQQLIKLKESSSF